jgi:acyl dehydratase
MLYAEDLIVGQRFEFGSYTIGEEEILRFARQYDPVPIHIDKEAAASGPFGGLIASGFNTLARVGRTCGLCGAKSVPDPKETSALDGQLVCSMRG